MLLDLLKNYPLSEVLIILVLGAFAIREGVQFAQWVKGLVAEATGKGISKAKREGIIDEHEVKIKHLEEQNAILQEKLFDIATQIEGLVEADKEDKKLIITDNYHKFIALNYIDDYSLSCLEKIYEIYTREKGNSFIGGLMEELRQLPHK